MDMTELKQLEQPVGEIKLSEAIREAGYGWPGSYGDCALARAYKVRTGRALWADAHESGGNFNPFMAQAAKTFGVPIHVAQKVEWMCFDRTPQDEIADYVAAQGF